MSSFKGGLGFEQEALANYCGVSMGWVQYSGPYTGEQKVRASCKHCNLVLEVTWKSGQDEGEVEKKLWQDFKKKAEEQGCPHIRKYEALQKKESKPLVDGLAMLELFKSLRNGDPPQS